MRYIRILHYYYYYYYYLVSTPPHHSFSLQGETNGIYQTEKVPQMPITDDVQGDCSECSYTFTDLQENSTYFSHVCPIGFGENGKGDCANFKFRTALGEHTDCPKKNTIGCLASIAFKIVNQSEYA